MGTLVQRIDYPGRATSHIHGHHHGSNHSGSSYVSLHFNSEPCSYCGAGATQKEQSTSPCAEDKAMSNEFATVVTALVNVAKLDTSKTVLPLIGNFVNSLAMNPNELNLVVQLASLEAGLLAAVPGIEQDELKELATLIQQEATALLAPSVAANPAKAANTPAK
jgi:hypothetical protein